ncbi:MAG: hypothetical protein ABSF23_14670 [Terracidiphilus sp.]|jgi:deoxycytidine triphosphate deaminase
MRERAPLSPEQLDKLRKEEKERLAKLLSATYAPLKPEGPQLHAGVLLSDEIEFYIDNFKLVDPYEPKNLMAASYELRVGNQCVIGDKVYELAKGEVLTFPKFEVVVVEILETINMPDFLIARWNIRTRWAYAGLIWVGGPQVNAGFRGRIMCPLWNLSSSEISIPWGEAIAVMDFVYTTPPTAASNRKPLWNDRSRYILDDYLSSPALKSGLVTEAVGKIKDLKLDMDERLGEQRSRMDTFTSITFAALGVLIAATAIVATKAVGTNGVPDYWWDPTVFLLCWLTSISALFAWLRPGLKGKSTKWITGFLIALVLGVIGLQQYHVWQKDSNRTLEIQRLTDQVHSLVSAQTTLEHKVEALQKPPAHPTSR